MDVHIRVQRWVLVWIGAGIVCGAGAIVNILGHHLTGAQDELLLFLGVAHWLLGGVVCWAFKGVKVEPNPPAPPSPVEDTAPRTEWHPASDFLLPGTGHTHFSGRR